MVEYIILTSQNARIKNKPWHTKAEAKVGNIDATIRKKCHEVKESSIAMDKDKKDYIKILKEQQLLESEKHERLSKEAAELGNDLSKLLGILKSGLKDKGKGER